MLRELKDIPRIVGLLGILLIITSPVLFAQQIPTTNGIMSEGLVENIEPMDSIISSYTTHDPITITANGDFSSQGFPGSGSSGVPYIIEGYNITTMGDSISISDTTAYFVIRDCLLVGEGQTGNGVKLVDVIHGEIRSNTIIDKFNGVFLTTSTDNTIEKNAISECANGVTIFSSSNANKVEENIIFENIWGIIQSGSSNSQIQDNTITGNNDGVTFGIASDNTLVNNTFSGNDDGIDIDSNSNDNLIYLNKFVDGSGNVDDDGTDNDWNSTGIGNYWSDYSGTGVQNIPGGANSVDYHPFIYDITSPQINHPIDIDYQVGTTGHVITWTPNDVHPSHYVIYRNGTELVSDNWDGNSIIVDIDGLSIGDYNYMIEVNDTSGNSAIDTVLVSVLLYTTTSSTTTTTTGTTTTTTDTSTTTETTATTTSTEDGSMDSMQMALLGIAGIIIVIAVVFQLRNRGGSM